MDIIVYMWGVSVWQAQGWQEEAMIIADMSGKSLRELFSRESLEEVGREEYATTAEEAILTKSAKHAGIPVTEHEGVPEECSPFADGTEVSR